jgi:hypothetical protein
VCAYVAAEGEDGGQIDLEHVLPVAVGEFVRWVTTLDAGAVEQNVDAVLVLEDFWDEARD